MRLRAVRIAKLAVFLACKLLVNSTSCKPRKDVRHFPKNYGLIKDFHRNGANNISVETIIQNQSAANEKKFNSNKLLLESVSPKSQSKEKESFIDFCTEHNKKLEIVCLTDKMKICVSCALFGNHKNHEVKEVDTVIREISHKAECIMQQF